MHMRWLAGLTLALTGSVLAQSNPPKMASRCRFDLNGSSSVGSLTNGFALVGDGSVGRQTWLSAAEQPRTYTVELSIVHFAWRELIFQFTPAASGTATLTLRGPWEQSPGGTIYRQEVLWDAATAMNAVLNNGSFETVGAGGVPSGWTRPYGDASVETGPVLPVQGQRYVRLWHDGPLAQTFTVTGGVPITLRFHARAQVPQGFNELPRLADTNSPAHQAARRLARGANLGNYLEAPPGQDWGARYTAADFSTIRNEGFDHVRLPIAWHHYTGPAPDFILAATIYEKADFLVTNALARGLSAIVNIHHFDDFTTNPSAWTNKFYAIWRQVSAHYSNASSGLVFELLNEPRDAATTAVMNPIYAEAIRQIRLSNPQRAILVGPSAWNSTRELTALFLPQQETNVIVTVHCYDPFLFTHQGATWTGADTATRGLVFPGPPLRPLSPAAGVSAWVTNWIQDYNTLPAAHNPCSDLAFRGQLQLAREWSDYYGRPIHIGEFGCYTAADPASRARFYAEFRQCAEALGLGWAMWDWKAGFRYWDDGTQQPAPGMREAMFPPPVLRTTARGLVELEGAIGKTYRIDRAIALTAPTAWAPVHTQTLVAPLLQFQDAATSTGAFYRAVWLK